MLKVSLDPTPIGVFALLTVGCDECQQQYSGFECLEETPTLEPRELYQLAKAYLVDMCFMFDKFGIPTCSKCYIRVPPKIGREWFTEARNLEKAPQSDDSFALAVEPEMPPVDGCQD